MRINADRPGRAARPARAVGPAACLGCRSLRDNLAHDILGAQQAGIYAVWLDPSGHGVPDGSVTRPDRIIGSLPELLA